MNPKDSLLLEIYYQNYVVNTLDDILKEKNKEEDISLLNDDEWDDSKENNDNKVDEDSMNEFWDTNQGIGYDYSENEGPMEGQVHKNEPDEVGTLIQGGVLNNVFHEGLETMDIISSLKVDIRDFFHIKEGNWDINNHHFNNDPIYDTGKEDEVDVSLPFLQDVTYNDISIDNL